MRQNGRSHIFSYLDKPFTTAIVNRTMYMNLLHVTLTVQLIHKPQIKVGLVYHFHTKINNISNLFGKPHPANGWELINFQLKMCAFMWGTPLYITAKYCNLRGLNSMTFNALHKVEVHKLNFWPVCKMSSRQLYMLSEGRFWNCAINYEANWFCLFGFYFSRGNESGNTPWTFASLE